MVRELRGHGGQLTVVALVRGMVEAARPCGGTQPWAIVGHWQAGPFNLNFSVKLKISTNFEIHNEGLPDVQKYSNIA
jgi:hypothetical protein